MVGFPASEDTIIKAPLVNGTYQLNASNKINALFTYNKYDKPHRNASALLAPESTWIEDNHATVWGVGWQSTPKSSMLVDVRVAHVGNVFQLFLQPNVTKPYTQELTTGQVTGAAIRSSRNRHLCLLRFGDTLRRQRPISFVHCWGSAQAGPQLRGVLTVGVRLWIIR